MATKGETANSVIGEGSVFEGRFYIAGSLRVDGKFIGELMTDEDIIISETGKVKTNIHARKAMISGVVIGNVEASAEIRVHNTGKVLGNLKTPNIAIYNGAVASGEVEITGGLEDGNIKKIIEDEFSTGAVIEFAASK